MLNLQSVPALIGHYGYIFLLLAAIIEGPIITVIAGAVISLGYVSLVPAYLVIVLGDTVGDVLHYAAGRYGGKPLIERWGRFLGVHSSHIASLEQAFERHEVKSYILGKLAHGVGGAVLVIAGLVRAPFGRFLWWNVLGTAVKSLALLALGYYFAHALEKISSIFDVLASALIILSVLLFFGGFWWYGRKYKIS